MYLLAVKTIDSLIVCFVQRLANFESIEYIEVKSHTKTKRAFA